MRRDEDGPYALETLRAAGVPQLFATDAKALTARYVAAFEASSGRKLYPMQVEMLQIETLAYAMSLLGLEGQRAVEEGLVAYATEAGLEALGPNRSTPRLLASAARATLRFSVDPARAVPTFIGHGSRVSAGSEDTTFLTLADAVIAAGSASTDVLAEAVVPGALANNLQIGQISTLLEPIGGVACTNISVSAGGADVESAEGYRLRLANAFERISAGSFAWYRETAMGVSPAIIDCAVVRPQPCYIDLYPLTAEGPAGAPLAATLLARFETFEALDQRYGDLVTIKPAIAFGAAPQLTIRFRGVDGATLQAAAIAAANVPLADWRGRLAADVAPSRIESLVRALPGVIDAEVTGLGYQTLAATTYLDAAAFSAGSVVMVPV